MLWFQIDGTNFFVLSAAVPVAKASNSNLHRKPLALSLHSSRTRRRNLKAGRNSGLGLQWLGHVQGCFEMIFSPFHTPSTAYWRLCDGLTARPDGEHCRTNFSDSRLGLSVFRDSGGGLRVWCGRGRVAQLLVDSGLEILGPINCHVFL